MSEEKSREDTPRGPARRPPVVLPDTTDLAGVDAAEIAVVRLAADGTLGSREALDFMRMLEHRRRVLVSRDHGRRMTEIEARLAAEAAAQGDVS
jgi:hypothetical protein